MNENTSKPKSFFHPLTKKKVVVIVLISLVVLYLCTPFLLRTLISIGSWNKVYDDGEVSSVTTTFHSDGIWIMENYDGKWDILSDFTFVYNNKYYKAGDWCWLGTHLYLGNDYQFTRLPFLYPEA